MTKQDFGKWNDIIDAGSSEFLINELNDMNKQETNKGFNTFYGLDEEPREDITVQELVDKLEVKLSTLDKKENQTREEELLTIVERAHLNNAIKTIKLHR